MGIATHSCSSCASPTMMTTVSHGTKRRCAQAGEKKKSKEMVKKKKRETGTHACSSGSSPPMVNHSAALRQQPVMGHIVQQQDCIWYVKALS